MPRKRTPAASRCWQILSKAIPGAKERQGTQIKITGKEDQNISTGRKVKTRIRSRGLKGLLALRLNRDCGIYLSTFPVVWYDGAPNHLLCSAEDMLVSGWRELREDVEAISLFAPLDRQCVWVGRAPFRLDLLAPWWAIYGNAIRVKTSPCPTFLAGSEQGSARACNNDRCWAGAA